MSHLVDRPEPLVLWVVPVADLGGVARHVLDVARAGIPGYRIMVLCPEGPLSERLRAQRAPVTSGKFGPAFGLVRSIRTLRRLVVATRPAIVHSHLAYADFIVAATPLRRRTLRFTTEHGIAPDDIMYHRSRSKSVIMSVAHTLRLRRFDGVIAVAEATKKVMQHKWHAPDSVVVIRNGVDPKPLVRRDPTALRILSLSRLAPEKRIGQLIEAFALVHRQRPKARLVIAGVGPLEDELKAQARNLGLTEWVDFPGFVDPDDAMANSDILIQLSVWENCSYTLLDAQASGLAIIATEVGGNPEILDAHQLIETTDPGPLAKAIVGLDNRGRTPVSSQTSGAMLRSISGYYREMVQ